MQQYPAYKDSLFDWLGEIPEHWEEKRAKWYFNKIDERSETGEEELLSVSHITGVTPRSEKNVTMFQAESYIGHKLCKAGDLVINTMWAWMAALGISQYEGIVSTAYGVYRPKSTDLFDSRYLDYLLRIKGYAGEYLCRSKGIWTSRLLLNPESFLNIPIVHPPLEDQKAIVAFLEEQTAVINQFLANKRQLITLLEEQKQVVINTAVTQGLNLNAPRKTSGIDWLGKIPAHWEIVTMNRLIKNIEQGWSPVSFNYPTTGDQWGIIKIGAIHRGEFIPSENKALPPETPPEKRYEIHTGDFLLTRGNTPDLVGDVCVVEDVPKRLLLSDLVYRINFSQRVDKSFLALWFLSHSGRFQIKIDARGSSMTMAKVSQKHIKSWVVLLPPLDEQAKILAHIRKVSSEINTAIERTQREIELIEEYRTTLIAHAVTGKIDVRPQQEVV